MSDFNNLSIMGRLCADPELRTSESGKTVCSMMVAVNRRNKDEEANFFPCVAFGKTADNIVKFFHKGNRILLRGSMQSRKFEKDGKPQIYWKMNVDEFFFCEAKAAVTEAAPADPAEDDDFPF